VVAARWKHDPDEHDYPAAASYLSLTTDPVIVAAVVDALRVAPIETYKGKDILRGSGLPALPHDNVHVAADLARVRSGKALSPVLLVRGDLARGVPLQIADGYHRVCAAYYLDEDTDVPCRIVALPGARTASR
jgi:hypothetical protein